MERLSPQAGGSNSAWKGLAWIGAVLATCAALAIGAVLAVFATVTVLVIAIMSSVLLALSGMAMRAHRSAQAKASARAAGADVIEARNVGGHSWVAYGWNERR